MAVINPYLTFYGNCEEALNFYKAILGGTFTYVGRFSEMPDDPNFLVAEEDKNKIMHISLQISAETILMASDALMGEGAAPCKSFSLSYAPDSKAEADRIFNALAEGGKITMPIADMFWGAYFGTVTDKYGVQWMVNFSETAAG